MKSFETFSVITKLNLFEKENNYEVKIQFYGMKKVLELRFIFQMSFLFLQEKYITIQKIYIFVLCIYSCLLLYNSDNVYNI